MLRSSYRRGGEPVAVACGAAPSGAALRCGLLFIRQHLSRDALRLYDESASYTVRLPAEYRDQPEDRAYLDAELEITQEGL